GGGGKKKERRKQEGRPLLNRFDSNSIAPGTDFMEELNKELTLFIRKQMSENGLWRRLTVLYSDHLTPGEGEHKIMSYIRHMKMQPSDIYDSNTRHCFYGLKADLLLLALVSHELHFALLYDQVLFGSEEQERKAKMNEKQLDRKEEFQLLHIHVLRCYLEFEFVANVTTTNNHNSNGNNNSNNNNNNNNNNTSFNSYSNDHDVDEKYLDSAFGIQKKFHHLRNYPMIGNKPFHLERVIDDFVFLCVLVGNDFIPSIPTINISTGGLEHFSCRNCQ
ncbi:hypothetical protein RFI_12120, partial [Reticulomyxa filosa]